MTTPSNQMEADLADFDRNYQWGSRPGELGRPAGAPNGGGLRALYCYFMDTFLRTIELNAHTWQTNALTAFTNQWGGPSASWQARNFIDNAMNGQGLITQGAMRFPRSPAGPTRSQFGVWGNNGLPAPFWRVRVYMMMLLYKARMRLPTRYAFLLPVYIYTPPRAVGPTELLPHCIRPLSYI